ncbi:MAG: hemerythrin domain-containing protein [Acidimicrobiia bacterium]|nr:hemerythrin domain-containing protein [Acidimicrobiia bacterium]
MTRERTTSVTEPLRAEHRELLPHLEEVAGVAAALGEWTADTPARLEAVVAFLRDHLVPHARAEEAALYPAVERAMGAPGATATMAADHVEIVRRIDALAAAVAGIGDGAPDPVAVDRLRAQLVGLHAILLLHFHKEEEVLLPVLDAHLGEDEARAMFAEMVAVAHPH